MSDIELDPEMIFLRDGHVFHYCNLNQTIADKSYTSKGRRMFVVANLPGHVVWEEDKERYRCYRCHRVVSSGLVMAVRLAK